MSRSTDDDSRAPAFPAPQPDATDPADALGAAVEGLEEPEPADVFHDEYEERDRDFLRAMQTISAGQVTQDQCTQQAVCEYFLDVGSIRTPGLRDNPTTAMQVQIEAGILNRTNELIQHRNELALEERRRQIRADHPDMDAKAVNASARSQTMLIKPLTALTYHQTAEILIRLHHVVRLPNATDPEGFDAPLLGIYQYDKVWKGLYLTSEDMIVSTALKYSYNADSRFLRSMLDTLRKTAPLRMANDDPDLVAVNNGVFNVRTKELTDFSPSMVFLSKTHTNYVPGARNPVIMVNGRDDSDGTWDVESWIRSLSDEPGIPELLWQVLAAAIRPLVPWDQGVWLVNSVGANGKGTYLQLVRNLCGPQGVAWTTIPLEDFGKQFGLETLIGKSAILNDESRSDAYIDDVASLKAIITHDTINITRKGLPSVTYQARALLIQCTNDPPRVRDKTGSWLRRLLLIPFDKNFRKSGENKAIKSDYIYRRDVLEYVLYKALSLNCYKFTPTRSTDMLLSAYQQENDPVLDFWHQEQDSIVNDLMPWNMLYAVFVAWSRATGSDRPVGKNKFTKRLTTLLEQDDDAEWVPVRRRPGQYISHPESLLYRYRDDPGVRPFILPTGSHDAGKQGTVDLDRLGSNPVRGLMRRSRYEEEQGRGAQRAGGAVRDDKEDRS